MEENTIRLTPEEIKDLEMLANKANFTKEEINALEKLANKINFTKMNVRYPIILKILGENATMIKELNLLRGAAGLAPYPVYQPKL